MAASQPSPDSDRPSNPAAKRRPRVPSAERHRQILKAAATVFAEHGIAGARTRAIADACGISEAILFRHFRSKNELFQEVLLTRMAEKNIVGFIEELPPDLPPLEVFERVARRILEIGHDDPLIHRLMVAAAVGGSGALQAAYVSWRLPFVERLEQLIADGVESGVFRPVEPRLTARAFVGMVMDCVLSCDLWIDLGFGSYTPAQLVHNNVPTFVRGLLADAPESSAPDTTPRDDDRGGSKGR